MRAPAAESATELAMDPSQMISVFMAFSQLIGARYEEGGYVNRFVTWLIQCARAIESLLFPRPLDKLS